MTQDEQLLREQWEWVKVRFSEPFEGYAQGVYVVEIPGQKFSAKTEEEALFFAAEFTRQRIDSMKQVREEIVVLMDYSDDQDGTWLGRVFERILARERAILSDLEKGMK